MTTKTMGYDYKNYVLIISSNNNMTTKTIILKKKGGAMENNLIVKSNDLIQARYELNLNEQKIILYAVSKLDRDIENFNILNLDIRDFFKLLGTTKERYTEIREVVRDLRKKEVIINTDEGEIITGWLSSIYYKKNKGIIELEFSKNLVPYLLQLKEKFTRYELKNILYLNNKHSIRIYELLKQYENIGNRTFTVDEIKEILMLKGQYERFSNFESRVLKPTMEEINDYTDLKVSYEKVKKGRAIYSIRYKIELKEIDDYKTYLEDTYNIKDIKTGAGLQDENFNSKQIMNLYEVACNKMGGDYETEIDILSYININYKAMLEKDNILNRYAYLRDMLEHDRAKAMVYIRINKKAL